MSTTGLGIDAAGNTYSFGHSHLGIQFNNHPILPKGLFVVKHDPNGNLLWAVPIQGNSTLPVAIATDSAGNSYVTGVFKDTLTIGSNQLFCEGIEDFFLAKIDNTGNVSWAQRAGGILLPTHVPPIPMITEDLVFGLGIDAMGNCYISGITTASDTSAAMFGTFPVFPPFSSAYPRNFTYLAKFNTAGQVQWVKTLGATNLFFNAIAVNKQGQVFTAGTFRFTVNFGSVTLTSQGREDIVLASYDPGGNLQWVKRFGGTSPDYANSLATDKKGDLFLTGAFTDTLHLDSFTLIRPVNSGGLTVYIAKLDSSGAVIWASQANGTGLTGDSKLALDAAGNSYVSCTFSGNVVVGQQAFSSTSGSFDVLVSKWDSTGAPVWAVSAQGGGDDVPNGIAVDPVSSDCYVAGSFNSSLNFGGTLLSTGQVSNFFLAKLGSNTLGNPKHKVSEAKVEIYPNPASRSFLVSLNNVAAGTTGQFHLYNSTGQLVRQIEFSQTSKFVVDRQNLPAGLYLFMLQTGNKEVKAGKIVLH